MDKPQAIISCPVAVLTKRTFRYQASLFWFAHQAVYGDDAGQLARVLWLENNLDTEPRETDLSWLDEIGAPKFIGKPYYEIFDCPSHGLNVPLNIQAAIAQIIDEFHPDQVIEILDCDMFHLRRAPDFQIAENEILVDPIYENWHLKSLGLNRDVISKYFKNGGKFYNGGFVPILGRAKTIKKILETWIEVHIDILQRDLREIIKWWAGMYALQAACENNQVIMKGIDSTYIPCINKLEDFHHIAHYSVDKTYDKKKAGWPFLETSAFPKNPYYVRVRDWIEDLRGGLNVMEDKWKRWIAKSILKGCDEQSILKKLQLEGYKKSFIEAEVKKVKTCPYFIGARELYESKSSEISGQSSVIVETANNFSWLLTDSEKRLTQLNSKSVDVHLEKAKISGFTPTDAFVTVNGGRVLYDLKLNKIETKWETAFGLDDGQFEVRCRSADNKKFRLVCHREYELNGKLQHLAIWHFERNFKLEPKNFGKFGESPAPKPLPLGEIWNSSSRIPIAGKPFPGFARIDTMMTEMVRENQLPGVSLAVSFKGRPLYARAFGYSDIKKMTRLTPEQPMRMFQCARPITSAAIVQLEEQGKLQFSDPVFQYLEIDIRDATDPNLKLVSIEHLLYDTAGFDNHQTLDPIRSPGEVGRAINAENHLVSEKQIIDYMTTIALSSEPGSKCKLSNFGYFLLGKVIEKASGLSYEEYVRRNIFAPLQIESMSIGKTLVEDRPNTEPVYYGRSGYFEVQHANSKTVNDWVLQPNAISPELFGAAGGWIGTPADLLKIAFEIWDGGSAILSSSGRKKTFRKPTIGNNGTSEKEGSNYFAAGWNITSTDELPRAYVHGGHSGSASILDYDGYGIGWALFANCLDTASKTSVHAATSRIQLCDAIRQAISK